MTATTSEKRPKARQWKKRPAKDPLSPADRRKVNIALVYLKQFSSFQDGVEAYCAGYTLEEASDRGLF